MRSLSALFVVSFVASPAWAANTQSKEREARTACLAGDPATGVRLLSELFVATEDPTFIFNQGRCFEQNRRYEDAIGRFEEFIRAARKLRKSADVLRPPTTSAHPARPTVSLAQPEPNAVLGSAPTVIAVP